MSKISNVFKTFLCFHESSRISETCNTISSMQSVNVSFIAWCKLRIELEQFMNIELVFSGFAEKLSL